MPVQKSKCVPVTALQNLDPINMRKVKKESVSPGIKICFILHLKIFLRTSRWNLKITGLAFFFFSFFPKELFTAWNDSWLFHCVRKYNLKKIQTHFWTLVSRQFELLCKVKLFCKVLKSTSVRIQYSH